MRYVPKFLRDLFGMEEPADRKSGQVLGLGGYQKDNQDIYSQKHRAARSTLRIVTGKRYETATKPDKNKPDLE